MTTRLAPWLLAACAVACSSEPPAPAGAASQAAPPPPAVVVARVERADVPVVRDFVARTEAVDTVVVRARVEAVLEAVEFEEGRRVSKDDVLFRLDSRTYDANLAVAHAALEKSRADLKLAEEQVSVRAAEAAVRRAKAALGKAQQDVERLRPLAEVDAVPRQDLDTAVAAAEVAEADVAGAEADLTNAKIQEEVARLSAKALVDSAEASVALAELDVEYCTIRSPLDGLIGRTQVDVGNLVGSGGDSELVTVSSIDPIDVTLAISEAEFLRAERELRDPDKREALTLILADDSVYPHPGELVTADRAVSLETGTLQIVTRFPNPDGLLRPGQFGRVRAVVDNLEDAVLVPQRSVMEQQGTKVVFVVDGSGTVALRSIQVGERYEGRFIVLDGLEGGEQVIIEGQLKARPGSKVTVSDAPAVPER